MSEESLDYLKLCPNYYSNWEDGCCMESCTINDMNECPIHYVKGLLEEKDKAIESWETMYKSVMQTCHNDKEEIERLNKQLKNLQQEQIKEMQEHQEAMGLADKTITNLVEDNRASQEWYKKQLEEKENEIKVGEFWHSAYQGKQLDYDKVYAELRQLYDENTQLTQQLAKKEEQVQKSQEMYFETLKELDELEDNFNNISLELWAEKTITQDKVSFCIEQLEKVRKFAEDMWGIYKAEEDIEEFIKDQIKRLKEME